MPRVEVDVVADVTALGRGLDRGASHLKGFASKASGAGAVFKGVFAASAVQAGIGAAMEGLRKFTGLLGDSVAEARESQKVGATTAQIIKSTGGAAKITAGQVGELATAISNKTGMDDEAIQAGSNLLLTFKNVRNEAGKGSAIFNRATQAAVDLSAAGFGSVTGASKMLGKALNDPVKGISALSRAGVTFTDQQKEQIKALVKSGDTLKAQKIIMGEVESQVGGVGAASATAGEKATVMANNLKEQLGIELLPTLDKLAGFFTSKLGPAISKGITKVGPILDGLGDTVSGLADLIFNGKYSGLGFLEPFSGPVIDVVFALKGAFAALPAVFATIAAVAGPAFGQILTAAELLGPAVLGIATQVGPAVLGVLTQVRGLALQLLPIIIGLALQAAPIIVGIVTQISGLIQTIGPQVAAVLGVVGGVIAALLPSLGTVVSAVVGVVTTVLPIVMQVIGTVVAAIQANLPALQSAFASISEALAAISSIIVTVWASIGPRILPVITAVFGMVINIISGALKIVSGIFKLVAALLKGDWSGAWNAIKQITSGVVQVVVGLVKGLVGILKGLWAGTVADLVRGWGKAKSATTAAWTAVANTVKTKAAAVVGFVKSIPGKIASALGNLGSLLIGSGRALLAGLAQGIRDGVGAAIGAAKNAVAAIRAFFPGSPAKKGPFSGSGWTLFSGRAIGDALGQGMLDSRTQLTRNADRLAEAATVRASVLGARVLASASVPASKIDAAASVAAGSAGGDDELAAVLADLAAVLSGLRALDSRGAYALVQAGNQFGRARGGQR